MEKLDDIIQSLDGLGFERIKTLHGATFQQNPTVILIPLRTPEIHYRVAQSLHGLQPLMNQKRALFFIHGHEVGQAYNNAIENILKDPELSTWKYIMTIEDDNLVPPDAHVRLVESIEAGPFDAASGIYFTKGDWNMPMAYGDAAEFTRTGVLDFRPIDIRKALEQGNIMEVNGIGMGCALWRLEMFRQIPAPWFITLNDVLPDRGVVCYTQDLYFCERARKVGKRFAVDMRVRVGHLDKDTGAVY